jgi:hypothetical protein
MGKPTLSARAETAACCAGVRSAETLVGVGFTAVGRTGSLIMMDGGSVGACGAQAVTTNIINIKLTSVFFILAPYERGTFQLPGLFRNECIPGA